MFVDDKNVRSLSVVTDDIDPIATSDRPREATVLLPQNGRRSEAGVPSFLFLFDRDDIPSVGGCPEVWYWGQLHLMEPFIIPSFGREYRGSSLCIRSGDSSGRVKGLLRVHTSGDVALRGSVSSFVVPKVGLGCNGRSRGRLGARE